MQVPDLYCVVLNVADGKYIVIVSVLLFAISTAISWSYYGDRCANYLFGHGAVLPYKMVFVAMHFVGAIGTLAVVWDLADVALAFGPPETFALMMLAFATFVGLGGKFQIWEPEKFKDQFAQGRKKLSEFKKRIMF